MAQSEPILSQPETVDLLYEIAVTKMDQQIRRVDALDTKTIALLAAASVVIAVVATLLTNQPKTAVAQGLLWLGIICYAALWCATAHALWTRAFDFPPEIGKLYNECLAWTANDIKHLVARAVAEKYTANAALIDVKARWFNYGIVLLLVQSLLLAGAAVWH